MGRADLGAATTRQRHLEDGGWSPSTDAIEESCCLGLLTVRRRMVAARGGQRGPCLRFRRLQVGVACSLAGRHCEALDLIESTLAHRPREP
jgi:hypothetical protein